MEERREQREERLERLLQQNQPPTTLPTVQSYPSQKLPSPLADRFAEVRELTAFAALQIPCARLA